MRSYGVIGRASGRLGRGDVFVGAVTSHPLALLGGPLVGGSILFYSYAAEVGVSPKAEAFRDIPCFARTFQVVVERLGAIRRGLRQLR